MFPSPVATREEGRVYRIAAGPSGALLALVMDTLDGEIRLLEAVTLAPRGTLLLGAARTARACAVAPGDGALAVATRDDVGLVDLPSGRPRWTVALTGDEPAVAFSPDGARVAAGSATERVVVLSSVDGALLGEIATRDEPRGLWWDAAGLVVLTPRELVLTDATLAPRAAVGWGGADDESAEVVALDHATIAVAGNGPDGPWVEVRARTDGNVVSSLSLEGDRQAEGLAFAAGVLFVSTEGGTYRADPPYDQLVRWLPPLGGPHDPTRLAAVTDEHVAVVARDVRLFRTRS